MYAACLTVLPVAPAVTAVAAAARPENQNLIRQKNKERFYNKCWGQYRIGADFSIIFLQNKSI